MFVHLVNVGHALIRVCRQCSKKNQDCIMFMLAGPPVSIEEGRSKRYSRTSYDSSLTSLVRPWPLDTPSYHPMRFCAVTVLVGSKLLVYTGRSYCPTETVSPIDCPIGSYCPAGTRFATQFPCPIGTFGGATRLNNATMCSVCTPGQSIP